MRTTYIKTRTRWDRIAAALAVGALLGVLLCWGVIIATDQPEALPPCATEDSTGCYWDADTMGNGEGHSFVAP